MSIDIMNVISITKDIENTEIFKRVKRRLLSYWPKHYNEYMKKQGLYGRTEFVRSIYLWHKKSKGKQCAIICGYAGSGKTTIIKYFDELPQMRRHYKIILKSEDIPQKNDIKGNTIVFFDYAIEMREKIQQLYKQIDDNKKISLIMLERDKTENAFRQGLGEDIELKVFNINETAVLSNKDLAQIINYHYRYRYDEFQKKMICVNVSDYPQGVEKYVDIIVHKVDPKFRRPIFAVFLGEILRVGKTFNIETIADQDYLCETYWKTVKSRKKYEKFEKMQKVLITNSLLTTLIEQSKIPILMASILEIKIRISFVGEETKWSVIKDDSQKNDFDDLTSLFQRKFQKLTVIQLIFFLGLESEKEDGGFFRASSGIVETEDKFDLLIAWLFRNCIQDERIKRPFLTEAVSCLLVDMKKIFLKKCFRYTEDYMNDDACILKFLSAYDDLYKNWPIEQYLSAIKEAIILYISEENHEIKKEKRNAIIKIYDTANGSLDEEERKVLKKNVEEYVKEEVGEEEFVIWQTILEGTFIESQEVLKR